MRMKVIVLSSLASSIRIKYKYDRSIDIVHVTVSVEDRNEVDEMESSKRFHEDDDSIYDDTSVVDTARSEPIGSTLQGRR